MLANAIDRIRELAATADTVQALCYPQLPETVFVRRGNDVTEHKVPPARRSHTVFGLDDVYSAVQDSAMTVAPEVYHSGDGITVLLDRSDRRDRVVLPLKVTERFARLVALAHGEDFDVRGAARLLRFDLHGTGVDNLIGHLRRIDFSRKGEGRATAEHGRESLGRSVEVAVQQADSVPETFTVETPVYSNPGVRGITGASVRCGIYLDVQGERIEIRTLADEVESALNAAQAAIGDALRAALGGVPVFFGAP